MKVTKVLPEPQPFNIIIELNHREAQILLARLYCDGPYSKLAQLTGLSVSNIGGTLNDLYEAIEKKGVEL